MRRLPPLSTCRTLCSTQSRCIHLRLFWRIQCQDLRWLPPSPGTTPDPSEFPPSITPPNADLPSSLSEKGTAQRRFIPLLLVLQTDESRCASIGTWPSALARKSTSPEWHKQLLPTQPGSLQHGLHPLQSTAGPFSEVSVIICSFNHGPDKVLTLWKQAEVYLYFDWNRVNCYPAQAAHHLHKLGCLSRLPLPTASPLYP